MRLGRWMVSALRGGNFGLDGGAMFGTVPKVIWAKLMPPDASNRIPMAATVLLLEDGERRVLVETGCGDKGDAVYRERLALEPGWPLLDELSVRGISPDDITDVVLTHLHLDHAGGATRLDAEGRAVPSFPRATHWVQRQDLEDARRPNLRAKASYLAWDFEPLAEAGLLKTVEGEVELFPGVSVRPMPGHNRGNQGVIIEGDGVKLIQPGDLIPTGYHLQPTWAMGYDLDVETCIEERLKVLEEVCDKPHLLAFGHDPDHHAGRVKKDAKGRYLLEPVAL